MTIEGKKGKILLHMKDYFIFIYVYMLCVQGMCVCVFICEFVPSRATIEHRPLGVGVTSSYKQSTVGGELNLDPSQELYSLIEPSLQPLNTAYFFSHM